MGKLEAAKRKGKIKEGGSGDGHALMPHTEHGEGLEGERECEGGGLGKVGGFYRRRLKVAGS